MPINDRYHRQRIVDGIGEHGQEAIENSSVAIVGVGALGCMSASMLARAGVGNITLIDRDIVEGTNLQRQILFDEEDAISHKPKAIAAAMHLAKINRSINITEYVDDLTALNVERLLQDADIIVDGLDNFETRYVLNDFAVQRQKPYMFAGVIEAKGNVMTVLPKEHESPCLRCIFRDAPSAGSKNTCDTAGVLASAIGIASSCQVMDVIKYLTGNKSKISRTLLTFDLWNTQSNRMKLGKPSPDCPCCGKSNYEFLDISRGTGAIALCGSNAVQIRGTKSIDLDNIAEKLSEYGTFSVSNHLVHGTLREEQSEDGDFLELRCFEDGRVIVHGTDDVGRAKAICSRYVGN
ncbi:MAG: ThiF family adenylyltransferase [Planctomycetota bacterium]|nr:ThiF family adenylyltransferase [Planctomycetota bacterium]